MSELQTKIKELKELMGARTPARWETNYTGNIWGDIDNPVHDGDSPFIAEVFGVADANFIVAVANLIPSLIEAYEKQGELLEVARNRSK